LACAARLCRQRAGSSYRNRHQRQRRGRERLCEPCRSRAGGQCGAKGHAGPQNEFRYMFGGLVPLCLPAMLPCSPPCRAATLVPAARKSPVIPANMTVLTSPIQHNRLTLSMRADARAARQYVRNRGPTPTRSGKAQLGNQMVRPCASPRLLSSDRQSFTKSRAGPPAPVAESRPR
jgi:hypothetical protein